jgi:hypothetical protein
MYVIDVCAKFILKPSRLEINLNSVYKYSSYVTEKKLRGLSPQANYTDRAVAVVGEVVPTFAGRGCYVVSATDSHGR